MFRYLSIFLTVLFLLTGIHAYDFGNRKVITVESVRNKADVLVRMFVKKGFGLQKDAPNEIVLYRLKKGHKSEPDMKKKIKKYGVALKAVKKFHGKTAREDKKYFSSVRQIVLKKTAKSGDLAISARFYYCSFADKFCSVQSVYQSVL